MDYERATVVTFILAHTPCMQLCSERKEIDETNTAMKKNQRKRKKNGNER